MASDLWRFQVMCAFLFLYGGCQVDATGLASPLRFQDPQVKVRTLRGAWGGKEALQLLLEP